MCLLRKPEAGCNRMPVSFTLTGIIHCNTEILQCIRVCSYYGFSDAENPSRNPCLKSAPSTDFDVFLDAYWPHFSGANLCLGCVWIMCQRINISLLFFTSQISNPWHSSLCKLRHQFPSQMNGMRNEIGFCRIRFKIRCMNIPL